MASGNVYAGVERGRVGRLWPLMGRGGVLAQAESGGGVCAKSMRGLGVRPVGGPRDAVYEMGRDVEAWGTNDRREMVVDECGCRCVLGGDQPAAARRRRPWRREATSNHGIKSVITQATERHHHSLVASHFGPLLQPCIAPCTATRRSTTLHACSTNAITTTTLPPTPTT